jgi:hypothetical protein
MRRLIFLLALSVAACQGPGGRNATRDPDRLVREREQEWQETKAKGPTTILGVEGLSRNSSENAYFAEQARRPR